MIIACIILTYILSVFISYIIYRKAFRLDNDWTVGNRRIFGVISFIPVAGLLFSLIMYLIISSCMKNEKADW